MKVGVGFGARADEKPVAAGNLADRLALVAPANRFLLLVRRQLAGDPEQPIVFSSERAAQIIREAFEPVRVDKGEPRPTKPIQ